MKLRFLSAFAWLCIFLVQPIFAQVTCVYGSYTGTGAAHTISGLGFTPAVVIIKGGSNGAYVKTTSMGTTNSRLWADNGGLVTNAITGFSATGFSVGTISDVNASGTTYYFIAISSSFAGMKTGSYTGNNAGTRNIALTGGGLALFSIIIPTSGGGAVACVDGSKYSYGNNAVSGWGNGNGSGSVSSSGMDIYGAFNSSSVTYHYVAFLNATGQSNGNSYSGNNTDNRNYTGLGLDPKTVFIFRSGDIDLEWKNAKISTDNTMYFTANGSASNLIQSFITDGFQLGSSADVNGLGDTYYYMGFGGSSVSPLPIELFHFDAQCTGNNQTVNVYWSTTSESNNDYFTIEKSSDGIHFDEIGTVKGAGNSVKLIDYQFTDNEYAPGATNYYRLKQTDFDGKNKTFSMVAVNCEGTGTSNFELSINENPVSGSSLIYNLNYDRDGLVTMKLYNTGGKEVDEEIFYHRRGMNTYYHTLPALSQGMYLMSVSDGVNKKTVKLIKQ
jgi:hypothetical protein